MAPDDGNGSGEDDGDSVGDGDGDPDDDGDDVNLLARWRELESDVVSFDEVAAAVTDPTRRFLLYRLRDLEVATVEELARELAAREADDDADPAAVSEEALESAKIELTHTHLPKLSDSQFVEFDRRSATVRYSDPPFLLETVVELFERFDDVPEE